jgi:hypothetical protein
MTIGIYSGFVPVHVQVSELVLVPEGEIEVYKPSGEPPVTKYRIGPAQIEKVNEYFAQKTKYSPWALREKSYEPEELFYDNETGLVLDFEEGDKKSRSRPKVTSSKTRNKKRVGLTSTELAVGGL